MTVKRGTGVFLILFIILIIGLTIIPKSKAQIPITVYGNVYMPDGSPASGATVTVKAGGTSKTTTTDATGRYKVDLTVESTPVTVTVTAKKGDYKGSASKTVEGSARIDVHLKAPPPPPPPEKPKVSIQIWCETTEVAVNSTVTVHGKVDKDIAEVVVVVKNPKGKTYKNSVSVENRKFDYSFKPNLTGTWTVYAMFEGNDKYGKSTSTSVKIQVKYPVFLSIQNIKVVEETISLSGSINPPIEDALIMIFISIDRGKTWFNIANTTTNTEGFFQLMLNLSVAGSLYIKALFPGDKYYIAAQDIKVTSIEPQAEEKNKVNETIIQELQKYAEENTILKQQLEQTAQQNQLLVSQVEDLKTRLNQTKAQLDQTLTQLNQLKKQLQVLYRQAELDQESQREKLYLYTAIALITGIIIGAALTLSIIKIVMSKK